MRWTAAWFASRKTRSRTAGGCRGLMLADIDEPLVGQMRQRRADVALLVGEDGARIVVRRAGLDVDVAAERADAGHRIGVERVAGNDILAVAGAEFEHRDVL